MGEVLSLLGSGLLQAFEPLNLFMIFAGCLAGLFIGAMPGLGPVNGVAILLYYSHCSHRLWRNSHSNSDRTKSLR